MLIPSYNEVIYNILYLNQCISLGCYNEVDLCNLFKVCST